MRAYLRDFLRFAAEHRRFLAFGVVTAFGSSFGQSFFIGAFNTSIQEAFGIDNSQYGALYSLATFGSALLLPWTGRPIDDMPLRRYTLWVSLGLVGACLLMAWSPGLIVLVLAFFALRQSGQGLMGHISNTSIARAFRAERGRALSVAVLGFPIGQAFLPVLAVSLTARIGWRQTWLVCAAAVLLLLLPLLQWLLRVRAEAEPPEAGRADAPDGRDAAAARSEARAAAADGEADGETGATGPAAGAPRVLPAERQWTRGEVLRDLRFWLVLPASLMPAFFLTAIFIHRTFIPDAKGWDATAWTGLFVVFSASQIGFSLLAGPLVDRFTARAMLPFFLLPMALGFVLLALAGAPVTAALFLTLVGCTAGLSMTMGGALWAELYGVLHLGAIRSLVSSFLILATAAAPFLAGWLIDAAVPLTGLAWASAGLVALSVAGVMLGLRLEARPA